MAHQLTKINLLPPDELENAPLGKAVKWAVTYGRYIIVVTELVVVLAFLSRFKLDRDLNDLAEEISRKKQIIVSQASFEKEVRGLQNRLAVINAMDNENPKNYLYLDLISSSLSGDVVLTSIVFTKNNVLVTGTAKQEIGVSNFVGSLKKKPQVNFATTQSLSRVNLGEPINFVVTVDFKI